MTSVVLFSGGVDSTVLLAQVRNAVGGYVAAVSVDYGQRHRRELWSAFQLARYYGATYHRVNLPAGVLAGSTLTGAAGPSSGPATVVPGRNLVLAGVAVAEAVRLGADAVYLAPHADDAAVYPDCRPAFVEGLAAAVLAGYGVRLEAPFLRLTKAGVVARGRELLVPFDMTWSCYHPRGYDPALPASGVPCGACGACAGRRGAGL